MSDFDALIKECGADLPTDREPILTSEERAARDIANLYAAVDELDDFFARP